MDPNGNVIGKPKFLDYLKAFGSGYLEKTAEDPEFAKKMMAGFAAMTMPKEGPTGFSPLGLSEFTQGYLSADLALQEAKPADQKVLEYLQQNPDQLDAFNRLNQAKAGILADVDLDKVERQYAELVGILADKQNIKSFDIKDYSVIDPDTKKIFSPLELYSLQQEDALKFVSLQDKLMLTKKD